MSLLATFFISDPANAVRFDQDPDSFPDIAEFRGLTFLEMSTLWAALTGGDWEELMDAMPCLLEADEGRRLIYQLPQEFLQALTSATEDQLRRATVAWAATEEMDCDPREAAPIVSALVALSRKALESGRGVFLWNCV